MSLDSIKSEVRDWLHQVVIGLELCPFAKHPVENNRVRYQVCEHLDSQDVLENLQNEFTYLQQHEEIETTLVILSQSLQLFDDYNNFLDWVDLLIKKGGWEGVFQVASFHPDYCFADVPRDSAENLTNRSPYPILHILREKSLARALHDYPDAGDIPPQNIEKVSALSQKQTLELFPYLFKN